MECSCDMSVDTRDAEPWQVFECMMVKARKQHTCCECRRAIEPGEQYEKAGGCCDGSWYHFDTCLDCLDIRNTFFQDGHWFEMLLENLSDAINAADGDIPETCIADLRPRARAMVCERIENHWEWMEA